MDVASTTHVAAPRFVSPEAFADFLLAYYGPTHTAAQKLDATGRAAFREDLVELARAFDTTDSTGAGSGVALDWQYRVVTATKKES